MGHSPGPTEDSSLTSDSSHKRPPIATKRRLIGLAIVFGIIVVLGLSIGLSVGLGLRNASHAETQSLASLLPLQTTPYSNFVLKGLVGQSPQTRVYNFSVSRAQGAPDGVSRPMLVVNGEYLLYRALQNV